VGGDLGRDGPASFSICMLELILMRALISVGHVLIC
jgi:hypothetical protein